MLAGRRAGQREAWGLEAGTRCADRTCGTRTKCRNRRYPSLAHSAIMNIIEQVLFTLGCLVILHVSTLCQEGFILNENFPDDFWLPQREFVFIGRNNFCLRLGNVGFIGDLQVLETFVFTIASNSNTLRKLCRSSLDGPSFVACWRQRWAFLAVFAIFL